MYFRYCNLFSSYKHLCGITYYAQKTLGDVLIDFYIELHILDLIIAIENKELIPDKLMEPDYLYESKCCFGGVELLIKTSVAAGITFVAVFDDEDNAQAD